MQEALEKHAKGTSSRAALHNVASRRTEDDAHEKVPRHAKTQIRNLIPRVECRRGYRPRHVSERYALLWGATRSITSCCNIPLAELFI